MRDLPERLAWARGVSGLKARALDRLAGLAEGHTSMIEARSRRTPSASTAEKLARALGLPFEWLVLGRGVQPAETRIRRAVREALRAQVSAA